MSEHSATGRSAGTRTALIEPRRRVRREHRILAISGSLRAGSYNTALLRAAQRVSPNGSAVELDGAIGELPLYSQDLDTAPPPEPVERLRRRIREASALLIATPEHNSTIPAALKNAIDWVSFGPSRPLLVGKPVAIVGASPGALGSARAQLGLRQVLAAVGAEVVTKPEVVVAGAHERFDEHGNLLDPRTHELIGELLTALTARV